MPFVQLIVWLIIIGVLSWAANSLLAEYMKPEILALINKLVIVLIVLMVLLFVLSLFGLAPVNVAHYPWG